MAATIVSVSRRTDIPAFFTPWFLERLRAEHVMVRNPRNPRQVIHVSLLPEDVAAFVFWSRNYEPLLPHLPAIDARGYRACFHLTLTGYGSPLELRSPPIDAVIDQFRRLASLVGRRRVCWRYDPVVLSSLWGPRYHVERFRELADRIVPFSEQCITSFLDLYPSTRRELQKISAAHGTRFEKPSRAVQSELMCELVEVASHVGIQLRACCEPGFADSVPRAACISAELVASFTGRPVESFRPSPTRKGCGCAFARDIGAYHTCAHGCVYCYANESPELGLINAEGVDFAAEHLGRGRADPDADEQ